MSLTNAEGRIKDKSAFKFSKQVHIVSSATEGCLGNILKVP